MEAIEFQNEAVAGPIRSGGGGGNGKETPT